MTVHKARASFKHTQPRFKIFYENGSTYDDTSGPIDRAHKQGVVVILMEDSEEGQRFEHDSDFYCYFPHGWVGLSQYGLYDYLASPGTKLVLFGRVVNNEKRNAIFHTAMHDKHLKG